MNGNGGRPCSGSDLSSASTGCLANGQQVGPLESLEKGMEGRRAEGEPEHKSGVVLQGLIMCARGYAFLDAVLVLERMAPGRCCK